MLIDLRTRGRSPPSAALRLPSQAHAFRSPTPSVAGPGFLEPFLREWLAPLCAGVPALAEAGGADLDHHKSFVVRCQLSRTLALTLTLTLTSTQPYP